MGTASPRRELSPSNATLQAALRKTHPACSLILAALPGVASAHSRLDSGLTREHKDLLTVLEFFLWLVLTLALLDQIVRPLQTLANVVGALREEDYPFALAGPLPMTRWASSRSKSILSPTS